MNAPAARLTLHDGGSPPLSTVDPDGEIQPWDPYVVGYFQSDKGGSVVLDPDKVSRNPFGAQNAIMTLIAAGARIIIGRDRGTE